MPFSCSTTWVFRTQCVIVGGTHDVEKPWMLDPNKASIHSCVPHSLALDGHCNMCAPPSC